MNPSDDPMFQEEHRWAAHALPWLVNGTVAGADALRLNAHLQHCARCRQDLETERALAQRLAAAPVVEYAPQASLARMLRRLESPAVSAASPWWRRLRETGKSERSPLVLVFAAQAAAVAVLSLTVVWLVMRPVPTPPPDYRTLSSPAPSVQAQFQVVFADHLSAADLRASLGRIGGHIVAGPSRAGVFLVALDAPGTDPRTLAAATDAALRLLVADPGVRYVAALPPPAP